MRSTRRVHGSRPFAGQLSSRFAAALSLPPPGWPWCWTDAGRPPRRPQHAARWGLPDPDGVDCDVFTVRLAGATPPGAAGALRPADIDVAASRARTLRVDSGRGVCRTGQLCAAVSG